MRVDARGPGLLAAMSPMMVAVVVVAALAGGSLKAGGWRAPDAAAARPPVAQAPAAAPAPPVDATSLAIGALGIAGSIAVQALRVWRDRDKAQLKAALDGALAELARAKAELRDLRLVDRIVEGVARRLLEGRPDAARARQLDANKGVEIIPLAAPGQDSLNTEGHRP